MSRERHLTPNYFMGLKALKENPEGLTANELAQAVGISKRNILMHIRLWREKGLAYVCGWQRAERENGGDWAPMYGYVLSAHVRDIKKPKKMSEREKQAAYREKNRAMINARRRARRADPGPRTPFSHLTARSGLV
jgi:transcription initiation factor IIE alpha subunit